MQRYENMNERPVPAPRTKHTTPKTATQDVCQGHTPAVPDRTPPPVPTKQHKIMKAGGQPLPRMAPVSAVWDSENSHKMMKSLCLQPTGEAPGQLSNPGTNEQRKLLAKRAPVHQRSWDESVREPGSRPPVYQRSYSLVATGYSSFNEDAEISENYMEWWYSEEDKHAFNSDAHLTKSEQAEAFAKTANCVGRALWVYAYLLKGKEVKMKTLIAELEDVADNLDKVFKGTKIAGITGGAAGAVGVAAVVGGVILAPVTMGASLVVAAAGVGVAAAGTVTGASAAITKKVSSNLDRKKVEKILSDYNAHMEEIERCVTYIDSSVEQLKKYDLSTLEGVDKESVKIAKVARVAGDNAKAVQTISKSSGVIQGFALGMDLYFSKKDSQKLKKSSATKFAKQIREVAKHMGASLEEMMKFKTVLESADVQDIV